MLGMQINWKSLGAEVGGRWFLYRKSLIPLAPFLVVTSVLASSNNQNTLEQFEQDIVLRYLLLFAANVASVLLCWLYVELASATLFRNRSVTPVKWFWVLLFGASLGFLKGTSTGAFSYILGSENDFETAVTNRILQTSILGLWTLPALALLTATYFKYQTEREALIGEKIKVAAQSEATGVIPDHQNSLRTFITESKAQISQLQQHRQGPPNPAALAKVLRSLIEDGLRPIAHQIWMTEQRNRSGFRLRDLTLLALGKNPFPLTLVGLSLLIGLLPLNLVAYSGVEALVRTLVTVTLVVSVFGVFLLLNKTLRVHPALLFLAGNIFASTLGFGLTAAVFGDEITQESLVLVFSLLLWLLQITLFTSVITEVLTSRSEVRTELLKLTGRADVSADVARAANRFASRELAQHVHSNIQNQILARALTLDTQNLTEAEIDQQLNEVQTLLDRAIDTNQVANQDSLLVSLNEIAARWLGFVQIDLDFDLDQSQINATSSRAIVQVVSEAISNSVRHGLAQAVSIRIARIVSDESFLEIRVRDDGLGPRSGPTGLGTELFAAVSLNNWEIRSRETGGTELIIRVPLAES
jgi:two-component sensor histidine kinase